MNSASPHFDPERLLAHASWMRELSRELLREPSLADDLVQQACLLALQRPPQERWKLGPWLHGVVRNLARDTRKKEQRRQRREQESARSEAQSSTVEIVQRAEMHRRVVDAALSLEDPYRSAILVRFFQGLSAEDMAKREGIPSSTVRNRIHRGLEMLRGKLDRDFGGDRRSWCLGLIPLAWPVKTAVAAGIAIGAVTMNAKAMIFSAAAICIAAGTWFWVQPAEEKSPAKSSTVSNLTRSPDETPQGAELRSSTLSSGEKALARSRQTKPMEEARTAIADSSWRIRGKVVDVAGRPISGAFVRAGEKSSLSNEKGEFDLDLSAIPRAEGAKSLLLRTEAEEYIDRTFEWNFSDKEAILALQAKPILLGVVRAPEGGPLSSKGRVIASVMETGKEEPSTHEVELGESDSFRLVLPPGTVVSLQARARGYASSKILPGLSIEPNQVKQIDLQLGEGVEVSGRVVNAVTGEPIPDALVCADIFDCGLDSDFSSAMTDSEGHFQLRGVDDPSIYSAQVDGKEYPYHFFNLRAEAEGYQIRGGEAYGAPASSTKRYWFEIKLYPVTGVLEGEVVLEENGLPVQGATIIAIDAFSQLQMAQSDSEGRFRFSGLPEGMLGLHAQTRVDGRLACKEADISIGANKTHQARLILRQNSKASVQGQVVDPHGRPLAGVTVHLSRQFHRNFMAIGLEGGQFETTNEDGFFQFFGCLEGKSAVQLQAQGFVCEPGEHAVLVEPGGRIEGLRFVLHPAATFRGQVFSNSLPASSLEISIWEAEGNPADSIEKQKLGIDGVFLFSSVKSARYRLRVTDTKGKVLLEREIGPTSEENLFLTIP